VVIRSSNGTTPGKRKPGKTILPPAGTLGTPGAAGGAGYVPPSDTPGTGPGGTGTEGTGTEGTGMGGTGYGSKGKGAKTTASASSSTTSSYDKYLAQQKAEANRAKQKAANRYVDQAQTLALQANALRTLLGLPHKDYGSGGAGRGPKGKGPKGVETTTTSTATATNAWNQMQKNPDDPRNRLKHPWQTDDGRGASGNRNKPRKGGLPGVNMPGGRRP
jgi:hypothetical protein